MHESYACPLTSHADVLLKADKLGTLQSHVLFVPSYIISKLTCSLWSIAEFHPYSIVCIFTRLLIVVLRLQTFPASHGPRAIS